MTLFYEIELTDGNLYLFDNRYWKNDSIRLLGINKYALFQHADIVVNNYKGLILKNRYGNNEKLEKNLLV